MPAGRVERGWAGNGVEGYQGGLVGLDWARRRYVVGRGLRGGWFVAQGKSEVAGGVAALEGGGSKVGVGPGA